MTDTDWQTLFEDMNEQWIAGLEGSLEAQSQFVDAWRRTLEDATDDGQLDDAAAGIASAYEVWLDAAERMAERSVQVAEGEPFDATEFRDIWLRAANQSFQEVMTTAAFAQATGEGVSTALDLQRQAEETVEDTVEAMGFASVGHIEEVGARLVELERRQHAVEQQLEAILEAVEDQ